MTVVLCLCGLEQNVKRKTRVTTADHQITVTEDGVLATPLTVSFGRLEQIYKDRRSTVDSRILKDCINSIMSLALKIILRLHSCHL